MKYCTSFPFSQVSWFSKLIPFKLLNTWIFQWRNINNRGRRGKMTVCPCPEVSMPIFSWVFVYQHNSVGNINTAKSLQKSQVAESNLLADRKRSQTLDAGSYLDYIYLYLHIHLSDFTHVDVNYECCQYHPYYFLRFQISGNEL